MVANEPEFSSEHLLKMVDALSKTARNTWLAILTGCAIGAIALASTSDAEILTNAETLKLPFVGNTVAPQNFFLFLSILIVLVSVYFFSVLSRLWWFYSEITKGHTKDGIGDVVTPWFGSLTLSTHSSDPYTFVVKVVFSISIFGVPLATIIVLGGSYVDPTIFTTLIHSLMISIMVSSSFLTALHISGKISGKFRGVLTGCAFLIVLVGTVSTSFLSYSRAGHINTIMNQVLDLNRYDFSGIADQVPDYSTHREKYSREYCGEQALPNGCDVFVFEHMSSFVPAFRKERRTLIADLHPKEFPGILLQGARLAESNMLGSFMAFSTLKNSILVSASLQGASFFGSKIYSVDFASADIRMTDFATSEIIDSDFSELENAEGAIFMGAKLKDVSFEKSRLWGADFRFAYAKNVDFTLANLRGAILSYSFITGNETEKVQFGGTTLFDLTNTGGAFRNVDFSDAVLGDNADFRDTFGDGSVLMPFEFARPCQWTKPGVVLDDAEFFGRWKGWIRARPFPGPTFEELAPEQYKDVVAIDPPEGCIWS